MDQDLEAFLAEALLKQAHKVRFRKERSKRNRISKTAKDYAARLSEKALYRRLINESNVAQDGIRFIFYFGSISHSEGKSLDWWRRKIDKEIIENRARSKASDSSSAEENQDSSGASNADGG